MTERQRSDIEEARPFYRHLGIVVESVEEGRSVLILPPKPEIGNSRGDAHGGAVATLLDAAMGVASRSVLKDGSGATTVSITVNYLEPGRGKLTAVGEVVRAGRSLIAAEARVTDEAGRIVAQAVCTMRVLRRQMANSLEEETK